MRSSLAALLLGFAGVVWGMAPAVAQQPQADATPQQAEYALKAAFLYNFALYTEWPTPPESAFDICILGSDPFGPALDPLGKKHLKGKPVRVRRLAATDETRGCHVLFIAQAAHERLSQVTSELRERPVLTIAESNSYDPELPMIRMVPDGARVAFEINAGAARAAGLVISSKLLSLARSVK